MGLLYIQSPNFSFFIINNLSIGVSCYYRIDKTESSYGGSASDDQKSENNRYQYGPVITYHFSNGTLIPFIGYRYLTGQTEGTWDSRYETTGNSSSNEIFVGVYYFISRNVA